MTSTETPKVVWPKAHSEAGFADGHPDTHLHQFSMFVNHHKVNDFLKAGWIFSHNADYVGHHERWSRMMIWPELLPEGQEPPVPP